MTYKSGDKILVICNLYSESLQGIIDYTIEHVGHAGVFIRKYYNNVQYFIPFWAIAPYSETLSYLLE